MCVITDHHYLCFIVEFDVVLIVGSSIPSVISKQDTNTVLKESEGERERESRDDLSMPRYQLLLHQRVDFLQVQLCMI